MSDNSNVVEADEDEDKTVVSNIKNETKVVNGITLFKETFEGRDGEPGKFAGFSFWIPQFNSVAQAIDFFTKNSKNGRNGDEVVTKLVNSNTNFRFRNRATAYLINKIKESLGNINPKSPEGVALTTTIINQLLATNPIIGSEEDALDFIPGEREVSTLSGLKRQFDGLRKNIIKLKEAGSTKDVLRVEMVKLLEIDKLIKAEEAKEAEALNNLAKELDLDGV